MSLITENQNLKSLNTFGIDVSCSFYTEINSVEDFKELQKDKRYTANEKLILGGGSNILFTKNFNGLVIKNNLKGIFKVSENEKEVIVKVAAGEVWHDFVMWCIERNYAGLENLSLIPGCVGAAPMQNIGAYGVEIKELFLQLEAWHMNSGAQKIFTSEDCGFGYRESVFKRQLKNQYLITSVTFSLSKQAKINSSYGAINSELQAQNITNPTIRDVSEAVIRIRRSKLPDPLVMGNAGSFFKNPEVSAPKHKSLKEQFSELVAYPLPNGNSKLAAGWLIEKAGLKGTEQGGAAVHVKQALVLINKNNCRGDDVYKLSQMVVEKVKEIFGVELEREVNII